MGLVQPARNGAAGAKTRVVTQPTGGGGGAEGEPAKQSEASWSYGSPGEPHSSEGAPESMNAVVWE